MKSIVTYILGAIFFMGGCMSQKEVSILDGRVADLEKQSAIVESLSSSLSSRLGAEEERRKKRDLEIRGQAARTGAELDRFREEIELLQGKLEVLEHQVAKKMGAFDDIEQKRKRETQRLEAQLVATDQKVDRILQYINFEATVETGVKKPEDASAVVNLTDQEVYNLARRAFDEGKLETSRQGFEELLKNYPKSSHADNAQFWIGEIYYREKWFEKAILEYQKVIENYPKGNKVPASRLKQGFAFIKLGDNANARIILQELMKKHPHSNEAKIAGKKLKKIK
jgi:tol-pal system protein YbgF